MPFSHRAPNIGLYFRAASVRHLRVCTRVVVSPGHWFFAQTTFRKRAGCEYLLLFSRRAHATGICVRTLYNIRRTHGIAIIRGKKKKKPSARITFVLIFPLRFLFVYFSFFFFFYASPVREVVVFIYDTQCVNHTRRQRYTVRCGTIDKFFASVAIYGRVRWKFNAISFRVGWRAAPFAAPHRIARTRTIFRLFASSLLSPAVAILISRLPTCRGL